MSVAGLLLAAGAGSRMGKPKALMRDEDGTSWLRRSVAALKDAGCAPVCVVLGAEAESAREMLAESDDLTVVVAPDWAQGMGSSLRVGLGCLPADCPAVVITLVDLPDVGTAVVRRVINAVEDGSGEQVERVDKGAVLARATYDGRPGHPVLVGREHWTPLSRELSGDQGARAYLARHDVLAIECGDLATGHDQDTPPAP